MYSIAREIKYDGGETGVFEFLWVSISSFANWLMRFALKYNASFHLRLNHYSIPLKIILSIVLL